MSTTIYLGRTRHELSDREIATLRELGAGEVRADLLSARTLTSFAIRSWCERVSQETKTYRITDRGRLALEALARALNPEPPPQLEIEAPTPAPQLGLDLE